MIAIDANLLVYAHRPEMPLHERALDTALGCPGAIGAIAPALREQESRESAFSCHVGPEEAGGDVAMRCDAVLAIKAVPRNRLHAANTRPPAAWHGTWIRDVLVYQHRAPRDYHPIGISS